jgi:hypothetical protein
MIRTIRTIGTLTAIAAAAAGLGFGAAHWTEPAAGPAACARPSLPSGDAMRAHGAEFVCTDGTWVHVTGYGN